MELRLPTQEELRTVYERDFTVSFPPQELKPLSHIEAMWREGRYLPFVLDDGQGPDGACFLWLGRPGWALLDYLCVTPGWRNDGFGSIMLELMRRKDPETVILCESECPAHAPDPSLAERRLGFYVRNGARLAGYDTELFGVHYNTLYWAPSPQEDAALLEEHRYIYADSFTWEKFATYVRIPRDPDAPPMDLSPWS